MRKYADLTGDGRPEIPVTSPWGLGVLEVDGFALTSPVMAQNGTRFLGGWLLNTADNRFESVADFAGEIRSGAGSVNEAIRTVVGQLEAIGKEIAATKPPPPPEESGEKSDG